MNLPQNDYQILRLTEHFYNAYPDPPYREVLKKNQRAYNCLLFQTHYDFFICIPYRTEIHHPYAFHFSKTKRSKAHKSGLDYSKIIIITKTNYLDSTDAIVDKDEYNETMINLERIKKDALYYVEEYMECMNGKRKLHKKMFDRKYGFSTLQYSHKELGIEGLKQT